MAGYIYCISNTVNSKLYVGKTLLSLEERFQEHCSDSKKPHRENRPLYRAMNKYGTDKFSIRLLEKVDDITLLEIREMYWIDALDSYSNGYNATLGGDGKILYDSNFDNMVIDDYASGISIAKIAAKYNCDWKTVAKRLKSAGVELREYLETAPRTVTQCDLNKNHIRSFNSVYAAAKYLGETKGYKNYKSLIPHIRDVIKGKRKTCGGYVWIEG